MRDTWKDLTRHTKMQTDKHASCDPRHVIMRSYLGTIMRSIMDYPEWSEISVEDLSPSLLLFVRRRGKGMRVFPPVIDRGKLDTMQVDTCTVYQKSA